MQLSKIKAYFKLSGSSEGSTPPKKNFHFWFCFVVPGAGLNEIRVPWLGSRCSLLSVPSLDFSVISCCPYTVSFHLLLPPL